MNQQIAVAVGPIPPISELASSWLELEKRARGAFFTSWTWIGAWLDLLARAGVVADLSLITARAGGEIVGLGIIGLGPASLRLLGRRRFFLHQTGRASLDTIYVEYNDFLVADSAAPAVRLAVMQAVDFGCGLLMNAAVPALAEAVATTNLPHRILREELCDYVELARIAAHQSDVRRDGVQGTVEDLLETLGRNSRQQIRRALRLAEEGGPLQVIRAATAEDAKRDLAVLVDLHGAGWRRKGRPGAFAGDVMINFVAQLVARGTESGSVDLLTIASPTGTLGVLLNFVYGGEVYAYQSGFAYGDDNRFKPGLVCHAVAIAHYRNLGCRGYHFMAGASRYKRTLSNAQEKLVWIGIHREDFLSRADDLCQSLWYMLRRTARRFAISDQRNEQ